MDFKSRDILIKESSYIGQHSAAKTLKAIAYTYPSQLTLTLSLVALENALLLAYPLLAGFAVDSIIRGDATSALFYAFIVLSFWVVGAARRALDSRVFTKIYADLAVSVVLNQRAQKLNHSAVAARVVLAREFIDFFEKHVPIMATTFVSIVGAAVMLLVIEFWVGVACLSALLICLTLMPRFTRRNEQLHKRVNDRLEKEIGLVVKVGPITLSRHYRQMSKLRVWLSDREASAFLLVGTLAAILFAIAITQLATTFPGVKAGHIYAVMTYLWTFVSSLDEAPGMADQMARLNDIGKRVDSGLNGH